MSGTKGKFLIQPLNLVGLESPSPRGRAVADSHGFAHLLSSSPSAELEAGGHGIQVGVQGPWHVGSHIRGWGSPQPRPGTDGIAPRGSSGCS